MPKDPQKPKASEELLTAHPQGESTSLSPETPSPASIPTETPEEAAAETAASAPSANEAAIDAAKSSTPPPTPGPQGSEKPKRVAWNKGIKLGPGGTKPQSGPERPTSSFVDAPAEQALSQGQIDACRISGKGSCATFVLLARTIGGKEWAPDDDEELKTLQEAWADTYQAYGWYQTPKWMPLVAGTGAYAVKRLNRPETASKVQSFKEKFAAWWAKRQMRKAGSIG